MFLRYRISLSLSLIFYLAFLAWLSLLPPSFFSPDLMNFKGADKMVHAAIYAMLSFLLFILFIDFSRKSPKQKFVIIFIIASGYGLLMELLQLWIKSAMRSFEISDIIANCVGVLAGIIFGYTFSPFLIKRMVSKPDF